MMAVLLLVVVISLVVSSTTASSSSSSSSPSSLATSTKTKSISSPYFYDPTTRYPTPSTKLLLSPSDGGGIVPYLQRKWDRAQPLALLEQAVEDYNAEEIVATASSVVESVKRRRCIVLPLDAELFNPPPGVFSHGHVDTGDKMSLSRNFWDAIITSKAEVPWLFEVSRVEGVTSTRVALPNDEFHHPSSNKLTRSVGGAIDFRCPNNFAFLPTWMFIALGLRPFDVVDIRLITDIPPGSAVRLRPHTSKFLDIANHQAVLETELKHYSALTLGSTIPFDYRGVRYYFDVVDLRSAPRGEKVALAKVQDCDIAAEFVRARDQLKPKQKKNNNKGDRQGND